MSIQLITVIAWAGVLFAALAYSLVAGGYIRRGSMPTRIIGRSLLMLAIVTVALALVHHAPLATVVSAGWLLTVLRTYPRATTPAEETVDEHICPRTVNSASANAWSSVAGRGGPMGFGSMTRLTA